MTIPLIASQNAVYGSVSFPPLCQTLSSPASHRAGSSSPFVGSLVGLLQTHAAGGTGRIRTGSLLIPNQARLPSCDTAPYPRIPPGYPRLSGVS